MRRWTWPCAIPIALLIAIAPAGCASSQKTDAQLQSERFWNHLAASTEAANAGDLEAARASLDEAAAVAYTPRQHRKVASLESLYAGTEALMTGDADAARLAWATIEDPALRREVRDRAAAIGMSVPAQPPTAESEAHE